MPDLYDRCRAPWQLTNLAEQPGDHAAALNAKRRRMVEWMASTQDHLHNEWTVDWLTKDPALAAEAPGRRRTKW